MRVRTPVGDPAWLVTQYAQVHALLSGERLSRAHPDPRNAPRFSDSVIVRPRSMPPADARVRALLRSSLNRVLSARRIPALSPRIAALVDRLLDELTAHGSPGDLHTQLSAPLPCLAISELMGVPQRERAMFARLSEQVVDMHDTGRALSAAAEMADYIKHLMQAKRSSPGPDLISDFAAALDATPATAGESFSARAVVSVLVAGHHTTMSRIDFGTVLLLGHRDQAALLRADPGLGPRAVEEILRFTQPGLREGLLRYAVSDLDVGAASIRAGELVILAFQTANRDPARFADPEKFDITRSPNPHLSFAAGPHYCPGAALARLELQLVFERLLRRLPELALAVPVESLRVHEHLMGQSLDALPVTW